MSDDADDPITLTAISMAAVGGGMQAFGQYKAGRAEAEALKMSEALALQEAAEIERASRYETERRLEMGEKVIARQRALYAKAGVAVEGTPMEVLASTAEEIQRDVDVARRAGYMQKARKLLEAKQYRRGARATIGALPWQIGATLLGGGAQAAFRLAPYPGKT